MPKNINVSPASPESDIPFQHYTLKHRVIAWVSTHLFDNLTYTVQSGLLCGMRRRGGLGWAPAFLAGGVQTKEHEFWKSLDLRGKVVYDVGAFQGLLTLFFARQAQQVISYEPNPHNRKRLEENVALNGLYNVLIRPVGIGSSERNLRMIYNPLMPGGASVEQGIGEHLLNDSKAIVTDIPVTTLDAELNEYALPAPALIKIDIEGHELDALNGARETLLKYRPDLFLEMHGETMNQKKKKVAAIVSYLEEIGYSDIRHVESGALISLTNSSAAAEGHLYCRAHP